jgi:hypothetical protein
MRYTKVKLTLLTGAVLMLFLSSCEVEYRGGVAYHHPWGWEQRHYPDHHEIYNHGYHHDEHGAEIIVR